MDQTKDIDITYLPANAHAGGLLPKQVDVFSSTVKSFLLNTDRLPPLPTLPVVLFVPELKANLNIWRIKAEHGRIVVQARYSFEPHLEEVAGAMYFYMTRLEHFDDWSGAHQLKNRT